MLPTGKKDNVWNSTQELKIKVWCNRAQCHLLVKEYKLAVLDCNGSRERPDQSKALWRRSNAYLKCGDYEKAHEDVGRLLRLEISEKMKKRAAKLSEKILSKRSCRRKSKERRCVDSSRKRKPSSLRGQDKNPGPVCICTIVEKHILLYFSAHDPYYAL